jgi:hypothetical protein
VETWATAYVSTPGGSSGLFTRSFSGSWSTATPSAPTVQVPRNLAYSSPTSALPGTRVHSVREASSGASSASGQRSGQVHVRPVLLTCIKKSHRPGGVPSGTCSAPTPYTTTSA